MRWTWPARDRCTTSISPSSSSASRTTSIGEIENQVLRGSRSLLGDLDNACVAIDDNPIAGLDDLQRILIKIRHARYAHDDGAERHLRRHLVEHQRLRRRAG